MPHLTSEADMAQRTLLTRRSVPSSCAALSCCIGVLVGVMLVGCGRTCDDIHQDADELMSDLGRCSSGDTCVTVSVLNDCLGGALVCGFAVPASRRDAAQVRAQEVADESRSCNPCAEAFCADRGNPICDEAAGRCVYPSQ